MSFTNLILDFYEQYCFSKLNKYIFHLMPIFSDILYPTEVSIYLVFKHTHSGGIYILLVLQSYHNCVTYNMKINAQCVK